MKLQKGNETFEFLVGDVFKCRGGEEYMVISSEGFDFTNDDIEDATYFIVDAFRGELHGFTKDLDDIWRHYEIDSVIPNPNSFNRRGLSHLDGQQMQVDEEPPKRDNKKVLRKIADDSWDQMQKEIKRNGYSELTFALECFYRDIHMVLEDGGI